MTLSKIPYGGVKEEGPSDCPSDHAIKAKRADTIDTFKKEPHHKDHGSKSPQVYQEPERFFGTACPFEALQSGAAREKHHADGKEHRECGYAQKRIGEAENLALPSADGAGATYKRVYVAGQVCRRIFDKFNGVYG